MEWSALFVTVRWKGREYFVEEEDSFWNWSEDSEEEAGERVTSRSAEGRMVILEGVLGKPLPLRWRACGSCWTC